MPLYDLKCKCGKTGEIFLRLSDFDNLPVCDCGNTFSRVISAPNVMEDIKPYKSMVTGEMISSRSRHRAHLKEHNCIEVGNEKPNFAPRKIEPTKQEKYELRKQIYEIMDAKT